jgi:hypothetical protein
VMVTVEGGDGANSGGGGVSIDRRSSGKRSLGFGIGLLETGS